MMGRGQAEAVPSVHPVCLSACLPVDSFSHSFFLLLLGPLACVWCALIRSNLNVDYIQYSTHTHTHAHSTQRTRMRTRTHAQIGSRQAEAGRVAVQCRQEHNLGIGHRKHARQEPNDSGAREKGGEQRRGERRRKEGMQCGLGLGEVAPSLPNLCSAGWSWASGWAGLS